MSARDCNGCPHARREFVIDAARALAAVALLPVSVARALGTTDGSAKKTYAIPAVDGVQIDKDADVILVRWQNVVYAFSRSCPHQNTALRWEDGDRQFQCPKHHSKYQPDGTFITGRATRNMDRLAIARQGGNIVVDPDTVYQNDENAKGWAAAMVRLA